MKMRKKKFHTTPVRVIVFAVFVVYSITIAVPYIWTIIASLKTRPEYLNESVFSLPAKLKFDNYVKAWTELSTEGTSVPMMFVNSLWYAVGRSVLGILFSAMTAYVVAKYKFPGRKFLYTFAIVTMMIPVMGSMAMGLKFAKTIGTYNSPLYAILNAGALSGPFVILYSTFKTLSWEYAEAAMIDGAGHFGAFFKIMLPQVISPMCALILSEFILMWTDADTPIIFFPNMPTLAYGLYLYQDVVKKTLQYPIFFAGLMTCMVPTVVLYAIFQKSLMDIQMGGGLKG
ncbi:MAG: carbohydrate ABC transporter permease [Clostridia bacterium]|nr:carbohydrate ABC transporter permease [Clostridia bacterium]MDY2900817.1 carbohydrate ABC transporter permease [Christensenellaceae bacterium]